MYKIALASMLITSLLAADEIANTDDPFQAKIDPLIHVKQQLAQARTKGWNSSQKQNNNTLTKDAPMVTLGFIPAKPPTSMQPSKEIAHFFESDCSKRQAAELCQ
ncbi:MAG: hypothetical protein JSS10_07525 [Verrucomicrobia bacterium]|nr:hypothetical protein [Verrucomicrobiota bacterium]